jgi:hypothetical protein
VRLFQKVQCFFVTLKEKWRLVPVIFKDISREVETFDKGEAFIKITRLFEDIFRKMEGL